MKHISLITTEPNDFMKEVHNRVPVILEMHEAVKYLSADSESNYEKCLPYKDSGNMEMELAGI